MGVAGGPLPPSWSSWHRISRSCPNRRRKRPPAVQRRMAMSAPSLRRADLAMTVEQVLHALERGFVGRPATLSEDGYPYCVPLLYVWLDNQVFVHGTGARGHLQANV